MFSPAKKLFISFLLSVFLLTNVFVPFAKANGDENPWYNQHPFNWFLKVYDTSNPTEIFGERYTAAQVDWIVWSILMWLPTKIVGPEILSCIFSQDVGKCLEVFFTSTKKLEDIDLAIKNPSSEKSLVSLIFEDLSLIHI